jgi:hypothetical protein
VSLKHWLPIHIMNWWLSDILWETSIMIEEESLLLDVLTLKQHSSCDNNDCCSVGTMFLKHCHVLF